MTGLSKARYEEETARTRPERMAWWRQARFGMFVHFGLYSVLARNEWAMALENYPKADYEALAERFQPRPGAPREWARLARAAGMKYMVLTTRHHDGFSLWDSAVNPYNSVRWGPKRDIVQEFVDACHEFDLRVGFYSSLMDWHHPDGGRAAYDPEARLRFTHYIRDLNRELMTQYGPIDILWYDVARPMESYEGWDALALNQMVRALQPQIIINNRSLLDEDFQTPEEHLTAAAGDWEACMTFNGISWGYVDSAQAAPYSYTAHQIVRMLGRVTAGGGNLLLNIGPSADGAVPAEAVAPLHAVGEWLKHQGNAVYGTMRRGSYITNGISGSSADERQVYVWMWIWPDGGEIVLGGFFTPLKAACLLADQTPIAFEQSGHRIRLTGLPAHAPDPVLGIAVIALEFEEPLVFQWASDYPPLHGGTDYR
jgi:alpha-L-fucosidase